MFDLIEAAILQAMVQTFAFFFRKVKVGSKNPHFQKRWETCPLRPAPVYAHVFHWFKNNPKQAMGVH